MPTARNTLIAIAFGTIISVPAAYAASSMNDPKQVTPPPTAGGNSAEPARSGKKPLDRDLGVSAPGSNRVQPSAGGNSAEPTKGKGERSIVGNTPGHDSTINPKYPSGGGNSASKANPARTSEKPEKK